MTTALTLNLQPLDWLNLFLYFLSLSLMAVGGAIATAPDMHRSGGAPGLAHRAAVQHLHRHGPGRPRPERAVHRPAGLEPGTERGRRRPLAWAFGALGVALCMLGMLLPSCC
jgi:chromate transporter